MKARKTPHVAVLAFAIALVGAGIVIARTGNEAHAEPAAALPVVKIQYAMERPVSDTQDYTGRLEAVDVVDVRPKVPGTLLKVHFKDGQQVQQGDLLFTIDPAPLLTQVNQAQANLAKVSEQRRLTELEQARAQKLIASNSISRKDFDALDHGAREAAASLNGAKAELAQAQLQLSYTQVRAPISGRISRAEITPGNVVSAGGDSVPLTRIVSDSKLYASFSVDEQSYLRIIAPSLKAGTRPSVKVGLANDRAYSYSATIETLDNQMDTRSGTVRVRARIDEVSPEMLPGLQARIRLQGGVPYKAVVIDDALVGTDQDRKYVLVVNKENKVERRVVETGALQGTSRILRGGLPAGSRVIVDGAFRAPGTLVSAVAAETPKPAGNPVAGGRK
ncbi:efflux RND transporter periplasmic adaptor subunit [Pseudoxanthomonas sp. SE1]|uniref:efflux RND transporter periplasmic adaptor subunit n=1 Tax=Pseudoxanthomonas sp. SE1 TaxID=1664560 RepID=UPI00240E4D7C|nr:efflux RND transporter periplasmic adaptor subunit [Pseudoxanthomonas sp. SE1]WFC41734.1 efflux RND transporter periplasmic adaptor subunit [Pseudoxanthomonas sp. SE1]